jgi:uncharacterized protein (DUF736 family)
MPDKYDNTNRGVLFPNKYKEDSDTKPHFLGNINVEGSEFRLAAWENTSKSGKDYLSIRVSEVDYKGEGKEKESSSEVPF